MVRNPVLRHGGLMTSRISNVCDKWSLEDLCEMDQEDMDELLKHYGEKEVPSLRDLRGDAEEGFDGSFGWWIG
jgi:precorrin-2 dehydrogenase/sirohydrochlorin ferrochelatase